MPVKKLSYAKLAKRKAARVLVIDPSQKLLMFEYKHDRVSDALSDKGSYFSLPGGGADEHESYWECALRELKEETGFTDWVSPKIVAQWRAPMLLSSGEIVAAYEKYFAVKLQSQRQIDKLNWTVQEQSTIKKHHWFTLSQVEKLAGQNLWPGNLPDIFNAALNNSLTLEDSSKGEKIGDLIIQMEE